MPSIFYDLGEIAYFSFVEAAMNFQLMLISAPITKSAEEALLRTGRA